MNDRLSAAGLKLAYDYLNSNPEKNLPKLMDWVDRFDRGNAVASQRRTFRKIIED